MKVNQLEVREGFLSLTDEKLIMLVRQGDGNALEYLIKRYERIVQYKTRTYFLLGSEREDVIQEGLIGLYKAICDYNDNKSTSFKSFADLCITRQIITSIKSATRLKHTPLNSYASIYQPIKDDEPGRILLDIIDCCTSINPEELLVNKEYLERVEDLLSEALSPLEKKVFPLYLEGASYVEIAKQLHRHEKAIDNALQRIKRKIAKLFKSKQLVY